MFFRVLVARRDSWKSLYEQERESHEITRRALAMEREASQMIREALAEEHRLRTERGGA